MNKKDYRYDVVSIDYDSIRQDFIDNNNSQALEKLDKLSVGELGYSVQSRQYV